MIKVTITDSGITVTGHAQRPPGAPPGHNIICAAVSALTLTLISGLEEVAGIHIDGHEAPGDTRVTWDKLNGIGLALVHTYILGLEGIRDSYGEIEIVNAPQGAFIMSERRAPSRRECSRTVKTEENP